jgi:glycine/D-amino acid oxidase-like deaminating enzyme
MTSADVVIIGGAVNGASVAFNLARLGVRRVVLLERRHLGAGASGKSGSLVRMHYTNEAESRLAWGHRPVSRGMDRQGPAGDRGPHALSLHPLRRGAALDRLHRLRDRAADHLPLGRSYFARFPLADFFFAGFLLAALACSAARQRYHEAVVRCGRQRSPYFSSALGEGSALSP